MILPVVLHGRDAWFLMISEECRLRVFENRTLGPIFGPKRDVNVEWRRLQFKDRGKKTPSSQIY